MTPGGRRRADGEETFDLIVVGGGIQGVMIALEAARRGLTPLLLEKGEIGGATTRAWFRILHGGLRYLQTLDVARLAASMAERRWFLSNLPGEVATMPFLMPLYGGGLKRPSAMRLAFLAEAALTRGRTRKRGGPPGLAIGPGRVLSAQETVGLYPAVRREGLLGGGLWQEAVVPDSERLLAALAAWARAEGAVLAEWTTAAELEVRAGVVAGVTAHEKATGALVRRAAPIVVNAAGPWSDLLAARFDRPLPHLFRPVLAFNLVLSRPAPCAAGLALWPPERGGPAVFLYPLGSGTFAGTAYRPWTGPRDDPRPAEADVAAFLDILNRAAPGLSARIEDVGNVLAGLQPAAAEGALTVAHCDVVHDHGAAGGPRGLFSVSGVKLTTARALAEAVLRRAFRDRLPPPTPAPAPGPDRS